jgi:UDP-N-acetylmuramate--alanine ligase
MEKLSAYLIGIGGSGMSAIARVLMEKGYSVSGSDRQMTPFANELQSAGAQIHIGHDANNIVGADLVVRSSAIPDENVEVQAALKAGLPVLKRSEFLGRLMEGRKEIAIAGTHGKTTTTAMVAWMLKANGLDPSYIIGSVPNNLGSNAHAGKGAYFVIEADEYDRMFLGLKPDIAVITNIEYDHPDCYPTRQDFYQAFRDFASGLKAGGTLVVCSDDVGGLRLMEEIKSKFSLLSYGLNLLSSKLAPDFLGRKLGQEAGGAYSFEVVYEREQSLKIALQVPGKHNVLNALACLVVAKLVGIPPDGVAHALGNFLGTARRFELRGEAAGVKIIDDYAHHPSEIRATLTAARAAFPGRRLWVVWQPHTYSRIMALWDEFATAFWDADVVVMMDIYAAREERPIGFSARELARQINHPEVHFVEDSQQAFAYLQENLEPGGVLLVLSAGDADQISTRLLETLGKTGEVG